MTTLQHSMVSRGVLLATSAAALLMTIRELGADGQGMIARIQLSMLIMASFAGLIAGGAVVFLRNRHAMRTMVGPAHLWLAVTAIAGGAIMANLPGLPGLWWAHIAAAAWLQGVIILHAQILVAYERIRDQHTLQMLQGALLAAGLAVVFYGVGWRMVDAWMAMLLLGLLLTAVYSTGLVVAQLRRDSSDGPADARRTVWRDLFRYGLSAQAGALLQLLTNRGNFSLLARIGAGSGAAGVYAVAFYGMEAMWAIARGIAPMVHGRIAALTGAENRTERLAYTRKMLWIALPATAVLAGISAAIPEATYVFMFETQGVKAVLVRLLPAVLAGTASSIIAHHVSGIGGHRWNAYTSGAGLAVLLALAWNWIPVWGVEGAAWAASCAALVQLAGLIWALRRLERA